MNDTSQSLRTQLAELEQNLRLIQERKAEYVTDTDIPLQLIKDERNTEDRIAELKTRLAQLAGGVLPRMESSIPVERGLNVLVELLRLPEVRTSVVAFRTEFEAACDQIDVMGNYKLLHDLLHTLQFHCYAPLVQESRRFPDDDMALDILLDYELTLQQIVDELRTVIERASLAPAEVSWVQYLTEAQEALRSGLETLDAKPLQSAIWSLNHVLAVQPAQINTRLNAAARALRLPALAEAMTCVNEHLLELELDLEKVDQFKAGVEALTTLSQNLSTLVSDHDAWQVVDVELRLIEANMRQNTMELEMLWPNLRARVEHLCAGGAATWAVSLMEDGEHLDEAIAAGNPVQTRRFFRRYRRQAGDRFYRVDTELKRLCEDLRRVGAPLASVLQMIGE